MTPTPVAWSQGCYTSTGQQYNKTIIISNF